MSTTAYTGEPANELERLIADLPGSGLQTFVFGVGWWVAHLDGVTTHCSADQPTGAGGTSSSATARRAGRWTCESMRSPASVSGVGPTHSPRSPGGRP